MPTLRIYYIKELADPFYSFLNKRAQQMTNVWKRKRQDHEKNYMIIHLKSNDILFFHFKFI